MPLVGIIMGSDSDLGIMKDAAEVLEEMSIDFELTVASAHRTPERISEYAKTASARGLEVIIAGAGGAAHLPGVLASLTELPIVGVPIKSSNLDGLDSLLSIVQMPKGIPVATVGINNAKNAGLFAAQILANKYPQIKERILKYREKMRDEVNAKAEKIKTLGYKEYLKQKG